MKRNMTCIVCPVGCRLEVEYEEANGVKTVSSVEGNTCPRGKMYAISEITAPVRTLTSTVRVTGGKAPLVPVKTSAPIPKEKLREAMTILNAATVSAPVKIGDVLLADFITEGVNLVACKNVK